MIFYKSKEELLNQIKQNKEELEKRRAYYEQRKKESLENLQNINEQIQNENDYDKINALIITLYQNKESVENLRQEKKKIITLLDMLLSIEKSIDNYEESSFKEKIEEFNALYKKTNPEVISKISKIVEKEAIENIKNGEEDAKKGIGIIEEAHDDELKENKQEEKEIKEVTQKNEEPEDLENILLISEVKNMVVLPYKKEELEKILNDSENDYKSIEEVIDEEYSIPLAYYKNFYSARFKEAYNLIKKKERRGAFEALDIAFEMASNRKLHPAVISACDSLDQLDIYLDCLDENKINEFPFFKVKFELFPTKPI